MESINAVYRLGDDEQRFWQQDGRDHGYHDSLLLAYCGCWDVFVLYSWPYIQSFGIYIFGYASIRYYGFLELLSWNATMRITGLFPVRARTGSRSSSRPIAGGHMEGCELSIHARMFLCFGFVSGCSSPTYSLRGAVCLRPLLHPCFTPRALYDCACCLHAVILV